MAADAEEQSAESGQANTQAQHFPTEAVTAHCGTQSWPQHANGVHCYEASQLKDAAIRKSATAETNEGCSGDKGLSLGEQPPVQTDSQGKVE